MANSRLACIRHLMHQAPDMVRCRWTAGTIELLLWVGIVSPIVETMIEPQKRGHSLSTARGRRTLSKRSDY